MMSERERATTCATIMARLQVPHVAFVVRPAWGHPGAVGRLEALCGDLKVTSAGKVIQVVADSVVAEFEPDEVEVAPIMGLKAGGYYDDAIGEVHRLLANIETRLEGIEFNTRRGNGS